MVVLNSYTSSNAEQQISFIQRCMIELKKKGSGKVLMRKKRILCLIRLYTEYTMRSNYSNATVPHSISHGHHTFQVLKEPYTEEMLGRTLPFDIHINILLQNFFSLYESFIKRCMEWQPNAIQMVLNSKCFVHQKFTPQRVESMHVHRKYQENICECGEKVQTKWYATGQCQPFLWKEQ